MSESPSLSPYLRSLSEGSNLSSDEAYQALNVVMGGDASPEQTAGFLLGLRTRGESLDELTGFTRSMREHAVKVECSDDNAIDIVGTGGDGLHTFNISTTSAFVVAGAGATVAKHGNRAISSKSGSADVLAALGVETELKKPGVEYCLDQIGLAFQFAPFFHPAMKHVMPVRKALGVRTFFNILGPLCNPAGVKRLAVGAFDLGVAELMAGILERLGAERLVSLHADNGMDEMSISGPTHAFIKESAASSITKTQLHPNDFGIDLAGAETLVGGDAQENATFTKDVLAGKVGPKTDVVVLNAGIGIYSSGLCDSISEGVELAKQSIASGNAAKKLQELIDCSQQAPN